MAIADTFAIAMKPLLFNGGQHMFFTTKMNQRKRLIIIGWIFIMPVFLIRLLTTLFPVLTVFYYSILDYDLIKQRKQFGGFINFLRLPQSRAFVESLSFTIKFTIISIVCIVVLGTALALLLKANFAGRKLVRTVTLIPWSMAMVVVAIAGMWMFEDSYGIVNDLIRRVFNPAFRFAWLSDTQGAQIAVIIVNVWKNTPFFAIIMLAAFQGIPDELFESAKIDGANNLNILFRIMIPYCLRTMLILLIFIGIQQINSFEIVYGMSKGGPGSATSLLAYRLYVEAVKNLNYGMASAITVIMFGVTAVYGLFMMFFYRRIDY
jgi:multiple sugar transport system permease protein